MEPSQSVYKSMADRNLKQGCLATVFSAASVIAAGVVTYGAYKGVSLLASAAPVAVPLLAFGAVAFGCLAWMSFQSMKKNDRLAFQEYAKSS